MIDAGLPLVQCLDILGKQEPHKGFSDVILQCAIRRRVGRRARRRDEEAPETFEALYSNMIAAGEAGGILDTILKRLAVYIEKSVKLKGQVKSAMIYPIAVICIAAIVVGGDIWKVIPTFAQLFAGLGAQLPLPTRVVIAASDNLVAYGPLIIIGARRSSAMPVKRYYGTAEGRYMIDALVLKMPILGIRLHGRQEGMAL